MEKVKRNFVLKLPARASLWSIISALVARGVGVVGTPIFTRLLTPEEYGLYPLYTTWLSAASVIVTLGITGGVLYRGLQRYSRERERFLSAALGLIFTVFAIALLLFAILGGYLAKVTGLSEGILLLMLSDVLFSAVIAVRSAGYKYEYKYKILSLINVSMALITPTLSVLIIRFTEYRAEARIFGAVGSALVIAVPQLILTAKRGGGFFDGEIWRYLLRMGVPLLPHAISSALILRASEMVIGRTHGQEALGKYAVALSVGLALTVLTNGLGQAFSPWILRKLAAGRTDKIREALSLGFKSLVLASLILLSFAPELIAIITPAEYHDALPAVYPLALSTGAMFLSNMALAGETYYERSGRSSIPTVAVAAISISAAILILPHVDYRFSALFTLISYVLLAVASSLSFKRMSGEELIDLRGVLLILLAAAAYATLLLIFREVLLSRIILSLPLFPLILALGKRIWREVKE